MLDAPKINSFELDENDSEEHTAEAPPTLSGATSAQSNSTSSDEDSPVSLIEESGEDWTVDSDVLPASGANSSAITAIDVDGNTISVSDALTVALDKADGTTSDNATLLGSAANPGDSDTLADDFTSNGMIDAQSGVESPYSDFVVGSAEADPTSLSMYIIGLSANNTNSFAADAINLSDNSSSTATPNLAAIAPAPQFFAAATPLPLSVAGGGTAEITGISGQSVNFAGTTGTLKLDDAVAFAGQISGLAGSDALDLADVSYGPNTTATFLGTTSGGTLTVTDGTDTAHIALVGDYLSSTWDLSSDGSGGTLVVDPVSSSAWQTLDVGAGGYVDGIDVASNGTMVARTDTYGAYIWNGTEWQQLVTTASLPAGFTSPDAGQGVYEIQIAPSATNILYMAYDGYVFQSTNDGTTWTQTSLAHFTESANDSYRMDGQKMAVDPENPNIVYVGTPQNGLFVTTNGGASWQSVSAVPVSAADSNGLYPGISGIEFDPALGVTNGQTNTIFAGSYGNGVYESTNAGASWTAIGGPSLVNYAAVSSTGVYYAVGNGDSLWAYSNGAWTELTSDPGNGFQTVAIDPSNPNEIVLLTGGGNLDISYNGGQTWSGDNFNWSLSSTDIPWLGDTGYMTVGGAVFNPLVPNQLLVSDGVGVWNTDVPTSNFNWDTPVVYNDQSAGIEQLVANEIIVPPGGDPVLASWDRGFFYISNPDAYPSSYGPVNGAFAAGWSLDYASSDPSFVVGLADWWGVEESGYSTNGGQTWTEFPSFLPGADSNFIGGTIAASTPENIIWAPADGQQPYYTLNGGETWNPITLPGVSSWSNFDFAYYLDTRTVTADRVLPNTFYLYYAGEGVYETTNGGVTWSQVYSGQIAPWSNYNAQLQSVPGEAGNLFFTGGPQNAGNQETGEGFYYSTNGGAAWTAVANVQNVSTFGFGAPAPGESYPSIYIVGWVNNVYGIWQSNNDTQSWVQIGTYPTGSLNTINTISGDPNIYGQVYVGFAGDGYAYLPAAPVVTAAAANPTTGTEVPGDTITLTLTMSEAVTVTGTPTLTLNDGGTANYSGGSGSSTLTFSYTVSTRDSDVSALAITQANLPNGATITDSSGNNADLTGAVATFSGLQIDPPNPQIMSIADTPGSGDLDAGKTVTLTLNFNSTVTVAGGTPTLTLNDGGTATYSGGSGTSALTFSYTVGAGQNTAALTTTAVNLNAATIKDSAGNAANLSLSGLTQSGPQIDTSPPMAPLITNDTVNANDSVTLNGTAEANSTIHVLNGSEILGTTTANASGSWSFTTGELSAGSYTFTATATDAAGNTSAVSSGIDPTIGVPTAPVIASFSPDTGSAGADATNAKILTLTGTAPANSTVEVLDGSTELGTTTASSVGAWNYTTGTLADGAHSFTATDTIAVNVSAASAALMVTVDTVPPAAPHITNDTVNANDDVTLGGSAAANSTLSVFDGSTELGTTTANASGAWNYTTGTLANGVHTFTATDTDVAGNVSVASAAVTATVGSIAPPSPIIVSDTINASDTITLSGTAETNSTLNVFDGSVELGTTKANDNGAWSYTTGLLSNGTHSFSATDIVGGDVSTASDPLTVTVASADPTSGDSSGRTHGGHVWARGPHLHLGKLIDSATLDDIFGTSRAPIAHHSVDAPDSGPTVNGTAGSSDGMDPITHAPFTHTETSHYEADSSADSMSSQNSGTDPTGNESHSESFVDGAPKPHWIDANATTHLDPENLSSGSANIVPEDHHDHTATWQSDKPMSTDAVGGETNHPLGAEFHSVAAATMGSSFAGLAAEVTDAFVFKSDLGDELVRHPTTALDQINLHDLFESAVEIHADLHAAAINNNPEPLDPSTSHLNPLHPHVFHIG